MELKRIFYAFIFEIEASGNGKEHSFGPVYFVKKTAKTLDGGLYHLKMFLSIRGLPKSQKDFDEFEIGRQFDIIDFYLVHYDKKMKILEKNKEKNLWKTLNDLKTAYPNYSVAKWNCNIKDSSEKSNLEGSNMRGFQDTFISFK